MQAKKMRDAKKEQEKELNDLFKAVITAPKVFVRVECNP